MPPLPVFADMGIPALTPDWSRTPPLAIAAVGLCASCCIGFGGIWAVRHPRAALGVVLTGPGVLLTIFGFLVTLEGELLGSICLLPGLPMTGLGVWLLAQKNPFVGKSLILLILAVVSTIGGITALNFVTWNDPREELRKRWRPTFTKSAPPESTPSTPAKPGGQP